MRHLIISLCVGLIAVFGFQVSCYNYPFTQDELIDLELEQSINDDLDTLGINRDFLLQLAKNLKKAIKEANESRQLFQGNEAGGGNQGGFYQGGGGQQGAEEEDEEEETTGTTPQGPGALGILSGLFGIFSGIGTLNPDRIFASTVNFFPPRDREQAQMVINQALYKPTPAPPSTRPPPPPLMRKSTTLPYRNKNSSESGEEVISSEEVQIGPGSSGGTRKPGSYTFRPRPKSTVPPVVTTPFQDDEFDHEQGVKYKRQ